MSIIRLFLALVFLTWPPAALSLGNYCHGIEFILYRVDTSEQIYRRLWLSGTNFDWRPAVPEPLEAGSYRATAQFSSAAGSVTGLPQRGCALLGGELAFSLDRTPQTIAEARYLNIRSTVSDDQTPGFFSNDPGELDSGPTFADYRANTGQSAFTRGKGFSQSTGIGAGGSGFKMGFDAHVNVADNFNGSPPRASGVNVLFTEWEFELNEPSLWNLSSFTGVVSTQPGQSAYFGIAPMGLLSEDEPTTMVFATDTEEGWFALPVGVGAVVLPQSPNGLEAITLPPADIDRGQPYRLRLGTGRAQTDLGFFDAGETVDLVALTGSAVSELFIEPTMPPAADAPDYLPLRLVLNGAPATIHVVAHSAPLDLVFRDDFLEDTS